MVNTFFSFCRFMKTVFTYEISLVFEKSSRDTEPSPHCTAWLASNAPLSSLPLLPKLWITAVRYTQLRNRFKIQSREGFIRSLIVISSETIRWIEVPSWKLRECSLYLRERGTVLQLGSILTLLSAFA